MRSPQQLQSQVQDTQLCPHNINRYNAQIFTRELAAKHKTKDIVIIKENKEKHISLKVKINVMPKVVTDKDNKEVHKNIQLRFIDHCIFMTSSLDKLR